MRVLLFTVFIFLSAFIFSQKLSARSRYEKRWAFVHPFAAIKVRKVYKKCLPVYQEIKNTNALDKYKNGGKLDAFRHSFFMAAFAQKIKVKKIRKLGIAHEKGNHSNFLKGITEEGELADSLSCEMDLKNNELGFRIGHENKTIELFKLADLVITEIRKGEALYFKRNYSGNYLTCEGEIIKLEDYKGKWSVPKCLIPTDR
jgi:hypothetical protein